MIIRKSHLAIFLSLFTACASIKTANLSPETRFKTVYDSNKTDSPSPAELGIWLSCEHDTLSDDRTFTLTQELQNRSKQKYIIKLSRGEPVSYALSRMPENSVEFPASTISNSVSASVPLAVKELIVIKQNITLPHSITSYTGHYSAQDEQGQSYFWEVQCLSER